MLRRLHLDQPADFAFTPDNLAWAQAQITKYPEGREASAIIPLLWRAQEQEGWLTRPAIEGVAQMLGLAYMRALEVASFYFMFQLQPVGSVAHIQVCGTTSCMICGAEDLVAVCKEKIAANAHEVSADGKFSWEEVECLGSCSNAPMAQIGKDYYEDLTAAKMGELIDALGRGEVPLPGPQNGRYAAEPLKGLTSLTEMDSGKHQFNASVQLAHDIGDTVKRIDGTEVPLLAPWGQGAPTSGIKPASPVPSAKKAAPAKKASGAKPSAKKPADKTGVTKQAAKATSAAKPAGKSNPAMTPATAAAEAKPRTMKAPRKSGADDLKRISGVGPKLEITLNEMGFWHFDQIAKWGAGEIAWVDSRLKFKGRIERDDWISQAAALASES
ncbi:NADH-quinone oxidoreductase subunit E [Octadecabacter sp. G9-8]|uniref:NADH-quinone oxidoreductase subunit E n=1 Tax=Octadecabacter dasysiphoniae TaxID=2909341 RepID=A0ABS9D0H5_9RHOB|nr:NADH-quinone oxidoreductase subunit E [Octadecabacter dasysiphoniae]MCF2872115.1 NADH-quinone oxidoreductase subunit E [Octadecabacter dasysiphoniae]